MALYSGTDEARFVPEGSQKVSYRSEFRKDFARVIHCASFRRLQGKTQLFPGYESDFFRNRLTHSLEVGQIAESIAYSINEKNAYFHENNIDPKLCFTAALLHDIGHPPFGHNGEEALDEKMRPYGGFEGNAQTLRIVSQLEKKRVRPDIACELERRAGLNLTYRTLAAILKYDKLIPTDRSNATKVAKGYYHEDKLVVLDIKRNVLGQEPTEDQKFKTIECAIMDIADDIAYSTYDLEDSLKAGFLTPRKILTSNVDLLDKVAKEVGTRTGDASFSGEDVVRIFAEIFSSTILPEAYQEIREFDGDDIDLIYAAMDVIGQMQTVSHSGHVRTGFTSELVGRFIDAVDVDLNEEFPQLSQIKVDIHILKTIETLKVYTYEAVIAGSRVKLAEYRGKEVVGNIFDALTEDGGWKLLPDDALVAFRAAKKDKQRQYRVISDFVAGMTDRYAVEFYGRLHSDTPQTMFKDI